MYNDLISKSETIKKLRRAGNPHNNFIERNIESMPITYNIDEVLRQLKVNGCIIVDKLGVAENIIKNGGLS